MAAPDAIQVALDAVSSPAAIVDGRGVIARVNSAWRGEFKMSPWGSRLRVGMDAVAALLRAGARELALPIAEIVRGEGPDAVDVSGVEIAEGAGPWRARVTAVSDASDARVMVVLRPHTESTESRQSRHAVSVVNHELRTPLTSIRGSLGLLEGGVAGPLGAKAMEMLRIARHNTDRLIDLINDVLDAEKLEAGAVPLKLAQIPARRVVEAAVAQIDGLARDAEVSIEIEAAQPVWIHADLDRLTQVLVNLISNAIKVSAPQAHVTISVSSADGHAKLAVVDRGPGIPPEAMAELFERYRQYRPDGRYPGTGLGLAIARSIVEAHHGRVVTHSEVGHGCTFCVELPEGMPQ